jgi:hypothetical protein
MKLIFVVTLTISSFCFLSSCARNTANQNTNSATAAPSPAPPASNLSPSDTIKAYIEAAQKKDLTQMERYLSGGSIQLIERVAKEQNTSPDEELSRMVDQVTESQEGSEPEFRNETIDGEAASVELKNSVTGGWDKIPLSRENGSWKIALDKQVEELLKDSDKIEINKQGGEEPNN